jgi:hypothetical protein
MHVEASYLWRQVAMMGEAQTLEPNSRSPARFAFTSRYRPVTGRAAGFATSLDEVVTATHAPGGPDSREEDHRGPPGELVDVRV